MATYGKKKKNIISDFVYFQDGSSSEDTDEILAFRGVKGRRWAKGKLHGRNEVRLGIVDSSPDELASENEANVDELVKSPKTTSSSQPKEQPGSHRLLKRRIMPLRKSQSLFHYDAHPLNLRADVSKTQPSETKLRISSPVSQTLRQSFTSDAIAANFFHEETYSKLKDEHHESPKASSTAFDAVGLTQRISSAMSQGTSSGKHDSTSLQPINSSASNSPQSKHGSFVRSKHALKQAGRVLSEHLVTESWKERRGWKILHEAKQQEIQEILHNLHPSCAAAAAENENETKEDAIQRRLERRLAEGANLSNPKIRSLTGDGKIPRKPHGSYANLRRPLIIDPFSDDDIDDETSSLKISTLHGGDVGFTLPKRKISTEYLGTKNFEGRQVKRDGLFLESQAVEDALKIALKDESDSGFHTESPFAQSTPRLQTFLRQDDLCKNRLSTIDGSSVENLSATSSTKDNFRSIIAGTVGENGVDTQIQSARPTGVKRKSFKDDNPRSPRRLTKRTKQAVLNARDHCQLASGMANLTTTSKKGLLTAKDGNKGPVKRDFQPAKQDGLGTLTVPKNRLRESAYCFPNLSNVNEFDARTTTYKSTAFPGSLRKPQRVTSLPPLPRSQNHNALSSFLQGEGKAGNDQARLLCEADAAETEGRFSSATDDFSADELQMY